MRVTPHLSRFTPQLSEEKDGTQEGKVADFGVRLTAGSGSRGPRGPKCQGELREPQRKRRRAMKSQTGASDVASTSAAM